MLTRPSLYLHNQQGFSMTETLTAVFIVGIGLLGHLSVQSMTLSNHSETLRASQAMLLVNDMLNRLESNPSGINNGVYDNLNFTTNANTANTQIDDSCLTSSAGCSAQQIAAIDLANWQQLAANQFPLGTTVNLQRTVNNLATRDFSLQITWNANTAGNPGQGLVNRNFSHNFSL